MKISQIQKLYLSNFLTGLVFWYGIEKLFMSNIGINAVGVGIATALVLAFNLIFDIPSGILADKWSRKGMLFVSAVSLAVCSVILGLSQSLGMYLAGYLFYGAYVVSTSGTYQAIIFDTLYEQKRPELYSKIVGRAYALFLVGAGIANLASGFIASRFSFEAAFFVTVASCALNAILILSLTEPTFHKSAKKERMLKQLKDVSWTLAKMKLLRILTIVLSILAVVELFKAEFGQLYMLRYVSEAELLGVLWAAYAFTWALGSVIAHRFRARLNTLIVASVLPLVAMSYIDNWVSLVLFMLQAVAAAALINQIETRVQENTPSAVRASVLSILSALGRAIAIPASFALGWIIAEYNALWALRFVATIAVLGLAYWLLASRNVPQANTPITADAVPVV